MGVYKDMQQSDMFFAITFNNVRVSFLAFVLGLLASVGTGFMLFYNGVMVGAFQYFFYQKGLLLTSFLTIWTHGTLEISAIVLAGGGRVSDGQQLVVSGHLPAGRIVSARRPPGPENGDRTGADFHRGGLSGSLRDPTHRVAHGG